MLPRDRHRLMTERHLFIDELPVCLMRERDFVTNNLLVFTGREPCENDHYGGESRVVGAWFGVVSRE